jgi:2-polyprenyl-3-methyl-5-hydroxy-6-metoxy-1,4-benzoquinol methylase
MSIGKKENYYIHDGYNHRSEFIHFDDTKLADEWQNEVYKHVRGMAVKHECTTIFDIGCGSGFKLVKYFSEFNIIGSEREPTLSFLRQTYPTKLLSFPGRMWIESDFSVLPGENIDMVICADVIEHLLNPNELLEYVQRINPKLFVISTPDQLLRKNEGREGPPRNCHHIREWNMQEFHRYLSDYFFVVQHFISNEGQATQCAVCVSK